MIAQRQREAWSSTAQRVFSAHPSVATVSVVSTSLAASFGHGDLVTAEIVQASCAALPTCFVNDAVADLLPPGDIRQQVEAATLRGLHHAWIVAEGGATEADALLPAEHDERVILAALPMADDMVAPMAVGIDAAWLVNDESGAQVFVIELIKAMARTPAIGRIVLLSDRGTMPGALSGVPKVQARTWSDALESGERLDVLHRPYQPGADTDFGRYRHVARAVAVTILDFIAYDNPAYHESPLAYRAYRRAFDAKVRQADQLFAISRHVGERLERQFAHQLLAPVRSIHLGTDHLDGIGDRHARPVVFAALSPKQFIAVLGNDFAHKNRDFAVKVFAEMCRRGYQGYLVLAGFHLDSGSSYAYELAEAGDFAGRVLRVGALPANDKTWLLGNAALVMYPTSSEGFGLIPFEAAALGTPTAFVRFGPLSETMPAVPAAPAWRVREFADHVFSLLADPEACVGAVRAAAATLSWDRCAEETIAGYRAMLREHATWHRALAQRHGPDLVTRLNETAADYARRALGRAQRLMGVVRRT